MNQNEEVIELDLKSLLFYILRQWKSIVIFAVAVALLLGSLMAFVEYKTGVDMDMTDEYWVEYQKYQDQLALYRDHVEVTQSKIDALQDYVKNSVLMKADHRNLYIAKVTYYVDTGYQILPENTYQTPDKTATLTWYYRNYLSDYSIFAEIGEEVGLDAKYLMELVDVHTVDGETLSVSVSHPYEHSAKYIMSILQRKLQEVHDYLADSVHDHKMTIMMDTCGVYVNDALYETQQQVYDELLTHQNNLILYRDELYKLEEDGGPGELNVLLKFILWFVIGGFLGGVLAVLYYFVMGIFLGRVHGPEILRNAYGLPILGEMVRDTASTCPIGKMLNKWEGRIQENTPETMGFLAENIRNHHTSGGTVLVCSDVSREESEAFVTAMEKYLPEFTFTAAGSLLKDADALAGLRKCDIVLRMVSRDHTKNASLVREMHMLRECEKELLGFVFIV